MDCKRLPKLLRDGVWSLLTVINEKVSDKYALND